MGTSPPGSGAVDDPTRPAEVPRIGIGTYDLGPDVCTASVATALEVGYRHVDTAEMYNTEAAVGRAIDRADVPREDVFVATKVHSRNLAYEDVLAAAAASRDRLGVETIDLLYVHWPIRAYDPEDTLAAFDDLHDRGLIRHIGVSNFTPPLLEVAIDVLDAPLVAHQVECHPLLQQDRLRRYARDHGHYLVAYSPLAKGAVTEDPVIRDIAAANDVTAAQVSLAWLLSKDNVVAIPRSSSATHIQENFAAQTVDLDPAAIERIDAIDRTHRQVDVPEAPWNE
ncbi:MAG: aldo/keto reductase [Halobacteriaceae archaeon]